MSVIYQAVPFHEVAAIIASNEEKHKKEAEWAQGGSVDYKTLLSLSLRGQCVALCAKLKDNLIGYNVFIVSKSMDDNKVFEAENVGIFIEKEHRNLGIGNKLVEYSEKYFFKGGVKSINYTIKVGKMEKFLEKFGYKEKYKVMVRENV